MFVLSVSKIDVEVLDLELLLYYIFKVRLSLVYSLLLILNAINQCATSAMNESRNFDVIFDCTGFNSTSQVPAQWLKFATETIPIDIWRRFKTLRLLTPNSFALRYFRRLYNNLTSGAFIVRINRALFFIHSRRSKSGVATHYYTHVRRGVAQPVYGGPHRCVAWLCRYIQFLASNAAVSHPPIVVGLEAEISDDFQEVTMRHAHPMRVPVTMRIAQSHIRITTTKALPISNLLSSKATEIIPLSDINDVYNVSTGHDSHEFIIRKVRQGVTMYFSSAHRDSIVKVRAPAAFGHKHI